MSCYRAGSIDQLVFHETEAAEVVRIDVVLLLNNLLRVKVKVNVHTLDIAPLRSESPPQKRSGMARVL